VSKRETLGRILRHGFVPIMVHDQLPPLQCLEQMEHAGVQAVEISCQHPEALQLLALAKAKFPDMAVGAAAVLEDGRMRDFVRGRDIPVPSLDQVVDVGADFLVSIFAFEDATYERYRDSHVIIPGVTTPGEAKRAMDAGANLLKITNPHLLGGPDFFRALDPATYHALPYYVTGGMKANIASGYIDAGALAIGAGLDIILGGDYTSLQAAFDDQLMLERLREYVAGIDRARQRHQPDVPYAAGDVEAIQAATGRCLNL